MSRHMFSLAMFSALSASCDRPTDEAPPGYVAGDDLPSSTIGDARVGHKLFTEKYCSNCHSYEGVGGDDAPPLDFMKERLSATEVANMSGAIWNHLPNMIMFFEQEKIAVPTFADTEMADLIAYLHGGQPDNDQSETSYTRGDNLPSFTIGDAAKGERLFADKSCSVCHTFDGVGGDDAAALDYMKGDLSAGEIAGMAGTIWNHMPHMVTYFEVEGVPVPRFNGTEMPDLVAYLHAGRAN